MPLLAAPPAVRMPGTSGEPMDDGLLSLLRRSPPISKFRTLEALVKAMSLLKPPLRRSIAATVVGADKVVVRFAAVAARLGTSPEPKPTS